MLQSAEVIFIQYLIFKFIVNIDTIEHSQKSSHMLPTLQEKIITADYKFILL